MSTFSAVAVLCALAVFAPIAPVVVTLSVSEVTVPGTLTPSTSFATIPPPGGKTTSGVLGTATVPSALVTVAETPKASPLTLLSACAAAVIEPSKNIPVERPRTHRVTWIVITTPPT